MSDKLAISVQELLGQLSDAKTYQSELMKQNKELLSVNAGLLQTQKELQEANRLLIESVKTSKTQINKLTAELQESAPTPFDDNARRARATRLAEQQERFNKESAEYDRGVESARERARLVRISYAQKLLNRHKEDNRLRPGHRESSDEYPNKFDYRQNDLLDAFAENLNLNKANSEDHRDYLRRIRDTFDSAFIKENKAVISILRDPKVERKQYDSIKIHFDSFLKNLDEQRKTTDDKIRRDLGNVGDISRMAVESFSAPSYIKLLDDYINDEATVNQNKRLAIEHRANTINRTCQQFKHGMIGLRDIQQADNRQTHSEALQASLNEFTTTYGKELSNEQQKAIESGISATKQQSQSNTMRLRR